MRNRILAVLFLFVFFATVPAWATKKWTDPSHLKFPPLRFSPPAVEAEKLPSGLRVFLLENHDLPLVQVTIFVRGGGMYDPPGKEGLAEITAQTMRTGGAGNMTGDAVSAYLDGIAAYVEPAVRDEYAVWRINVPSQDLSTLWQIFRAMMREPRFEVEKIKTALSLKKEELKRIYDNPEKLAFREFQRLYFRGNVRGRLASEKSIESIRREDVIEFHRRHYFPANMMMAISGDVKKREILSLLEKDLLPGWENGGPLPSTPPPIWSPQKRLYCLIKELPQAVIITGQPAPHRLSPDYHPFEILDFIVGSGGFRSRIFQEVRTNKGLSYATGSFYRARNDYGLFVTYAITQNRSVPLAFSTIKHILGGVKENITEEELKRAKGSIINSFVFTYATPHNVVERQLETAFFGWPEDFWSKYIERVSLVSLKDVKRVARDYLFPDKMQVFVLGNTDGCTPLSNQYPDREMVNLKNDK